MNYNLESYLNDAYQRKSEGEHRPVIGITGNYGQQELKLTEFYYKQIANAGGVPVVIPPLSDTTVICDTLDRIDGLILSGGGDINPLWVGEEPMPQLHSINKERDLPELLITRLAYNRQVPMLGICRGIQTLASALGGRVEQDIKLGDSWIKHSQDADRSEATHSVEIDQDSILYQIYSNYYPPMTSEAGASKEAALRLFVNSFHHQAVAETGDKFRAVAWAPDGVIEAMQSTEYKSILGVQWHPECLDYDGLPLFRWLVNEAREFQAAKNIHAKLMMVDSHCDTPMQFFADSTTEQNGLVTDGKVRIDFGTRDPRILVDLHKMTDGQQDVTTMVCYLPQKENVGREYADRTFDRIEQIVSENAEYVALARTPDEAMAYKYRGKKSIMLGIENGKALEGDLQNIKHFADRGVVYITLCHNGDNDICDSARGEQTHGGLSLFGRDVIEEMVRCGIMIDLSHAAETTFYDVLAETTSPVVCSHSSCRALCNHPRNLTDDQMRNLAEVGGVMQVTLYHGFLREDSVQGTPTEATILDAMAHLDHAVEIMGAEHVGLGTDFDGDGGIIGLRHSGELLQFTRQLLARRYSRSQIAGILGLNWLEVMRKVQASRRG